MQRHISMIDSWMELAELCYAQGTTFVLQDHALNVSSVTVCTPYAWIP
jgi:hypothetical protein